MTPATAASGPMPPEIVYPFSDGKPMAESVKQLRWMNLLYGNLSALFREREDVFVAGDNFWYPVEGEPQTVFAPDVYVVFGRPKGDRYSYKQWEEGGIPLTVVFEILSPANTKQEMEAKFEFYDEYGVDEYYVYDPDRNTLLVYTRGRQTLRRHRDIAKFVSPKLGIRFEMTHPEMTVYGPDGEPFCPHEEDRQIARAARVEAADAKRQAARLAELSRKARRGQATPEEVAELERLEDELA
jgi:Uma2 family endonuclease